MDGSGVGWEGKKNPWLFVSYVCFIALMPWNGLDGIFLSVGSLGSVSNRLLFMGRRLYEFMWLQ